jgi:hypothetical protein
MSDTVQIETEFCPGGEVQVISMSLFLSQRRGSQKFSKVNSVIATSGLISFGE